MVIRLCLKDKSSVLARVDNIDDFAKKAEKERFISYVNYNSNKKEYVNTSEISFIRISSKSEE